MADRIEQLVGQLNAALQLPGVSNAWTMPVKARIDMLSTGVRTSVGLKISGADLQKIEAVGTQIEAALAPVPGTRSVFAERTGGGYFLDITWNREELARHGLTIDLAQAAVANALGGENVATTIQGAAATSRRWPSRSHARGAAQCRSSSTTSSVRPLASVAM